MYWCHCREGHVTILLPVWRFWPLRVIQTVEEGAMVMSTIVGHVRGLGPRTGEHGVVCVVNSFTKSNTAAAVMLDFVRKYS